MHARLLGWYMGEVSLQNGDDTDHNEYECGSFNCQEFESCLTDNFGDCGSYPLCQRCDFRGFC